MNITSLLKLPKPLAKAAMATGTFVKRNAPELLLAAGVTTSVAGFALAVNATPKAASALDDIQADLEYHKDSPVTDKLAVISTRAKDIVLPFAIPVTLECISVTCFLTSYGVMKRRHAALALAYQALDAAFSQYRMRVINELGPEKDEYFRTGVIEGKCKVIDEETGEVTEEEGKILTDKSGSSIYARYFTQETSTDWKKDPSYNMMFLKAKQKEFTRLLISRGYVFLNEVYGELGLPKCAEGQIVGWINDPEVGECVVDFGITEGYRMARRWQDENICEYAILLDFNVDGPVYEYLNKINARKLDLAIPKPSDQLPAHNDYPRED